MSRDHFVGDPGERGNFDRDGRGRLVECGEGAPDAGDAAVVLRICSLLVGLLVFNANLIRERAFLLKARRPHDGSCKKRPRICGVFD